MAEQTDMAGAKPASGGGAGLDDLAQAIEVLRREVAERRRAQDEQAARLAMERAITTASSLLLRGAEVNAAAGGAMAEIGRRRGIDRVALFRCPEDGGDFELACEWAAPDVAAAVSVPPVSPAGFPWLLEALRCEGLLDVADTAALPEAASAEAPLFAALHARSLLVLPVRADHNLHGFLCFCSGRPGRTLGDEDKALLALFAGLLGNALAERLAQRALRASEAKFSGLFRHSNDGILVHDLDGRILDVNERVTEQLGYSRADLLTMTIAQVHPDEALDASARAFTSVRRDGSVKFEIAFRRRDGTTFPAEVSASVFEAGGRRYVQGIVRDITERKRAEETRAQLEARLRHAHKMEAIGELAGGVAHDFNNILTVVQGNAELLRAALDPDSEAAATAEKIARAAAQGSELTSKLLSFAHRGRVRIQPVDLHAVIEEVRALLVRGIDRRIEIEMRLKAARSCVLGDPSQLQTALLNLAFNARDAMPSGGLLSFETENVALDARARRDAATQALAAGPYLAVRVIDTGVGIDAAMRQRIFEPFFTTKAPGKGTGLGLPSVYGCVISHRGSVRVRSEPARGSTFELLLPVTDQPAVAPAQAVEPPVPDAGRGRVLVVDDERLVREVIVDALERLGCEAVCCADGREAIEYYAANPGTVDLVILDMIMPHVDGTGAFRAIRKLDPGARVLICSGYSRNAAVNELLRGGALGFLAKPFRVGQLAQSLAEHLPDRRREDPSAPPAARRSPR